MRQLSLFLASLAFMQCALQAQDLRLVGTNLYDFSSLHRTNQSLYHISGTVVEVLPASVRVERSLGVEYVFAQPTAEWMQSSRPGDLLSALAAMKASEKRISAGQYLAMSPNMRQHLQAVERTDQIYVLHVPNKRPGERVQCLAVPVGTSVTPQAKSRDQAEFYSRYGNPRFAVFDAGIPFSGIVTNYPVIYRVYPAGIRQERVAGASVAVKVATSVSVLRWQLQQASNGVAYSQFDVGQRYLKGDGVESNYLTAIYWFGKAAAQGYAPADAFLKTNLPAKPFAQ